MTSFLSYEKIGLHFRLRVEPSELESLALRLQSCSLVGHHRSSLQEPAQLAWARAADDRYAILLHDRLWIDNIPTGEEVYLETDHLLDELVREASPEAVFLHAGAIVSPTGAGIAISGDSGAGKTSVVTACIAKGWHWLTDETLCFRPGDPLRMAGLKRNFNLKRRSFDRFPQLAQLPDTVDVEVADRRGAVRFFNPDSLSPRKHLTEARLDHFVFPEFVSTDIDPWLEPLTQIETAKRIARQLCQSNPASFSWLAAATRHCRAYRLSYHDPHKAVELLASLPLPALE
jgi:hypothetical protein